MAETQTWNLGASHKRIEVLSLSRWWEVWSGMGVRVLVYNSIIEKLVLRLVDIRPPAPC